VITRLHKDRWCFDLAFLDPAYRQTHLLCDILRKVLDLSLIAENGLIVAEHAASFTPPQEPGHGFSLTKHRRIGDTALSFYRSQ
jgi:16S rRNA G966 N2-methylase RsmD